MFSLVQIYLYLKMARKNFKHAFSRFANVQEFRIEEPIYLSCLSNF